ncbi:MAG: hypothetical protein IPK65_12835 [Gammaproteobacteria bacterium]|nr:hypothetical protein [Gammaproteobacteria bacterium]
MQITCAACGSVTSLDACVNHEGARAALAAALQVSPQLATALVRYLGLFRPAKRQLTMDRVARLLGELLPAIQSGRIERNGITYAAPVENWREAIEQMTNHGYLFEILSGMGERAEAAAERSRKRSGATRQGWCKQKSRRPLARCRPRSGTS